MSKRILALVLVLMMVLSLTGFTAPRRDAGKKDEAAEDVDFPTQAITITVPFAAGGSSDLVARLFAETAKKYCDQPFVIVDEGGGGGVPATTEFLSKPADGYNILYAASAPTCTQALLSDIPYDVNEDLDYLCQVNMDDLVIVVRSDCPASNMDEFVEWVKDNDLVWGASNGGVHYFAALTMLMDLGISSDYVPTEGGSDSVAKLLGGHVDYVFIHPNEVLSSYTSGETKIIGTMTEERVPTLEGALTCKEQGYDYVYAVLKGFIVAPGMDPAVRAKLLEICKSVLEDEDFIEQCAEIGATIQYKSGEEYKAKNQEDYETFKATLEAVDAAA